MSDFVGNVSAAAVIGGAILLKPKRGFMNIKNPDGSTLKDIIAQATIEEMSTDALDVTEHPVSIGANITDHAFKLPAELELKLAWSNTPSTLSSYAGMGQAAGSTGGKSLLDGTGASQVNAIYQQLLTMQKNRALFDIYTGKRKYSNMIAKSIAVRNDFMTENSLFVTMTCREVLLASIQTTNLNATNMQDGQQDRATAAPLGNKNLK